MGFTLAEMKCDKVAFFDFDKKNQQQKKFKRGNRLCVTSEMLHKFDWIQLILIPNKHIPVIQQYHECKELKTVHIVFIYLLLLVFKFKLICNDCTIYGQHTEWLTFHMKNIILYFFLEKCMLYLLKKTHTHTHNISVQLAKDSRQRFYLN